MQVENEGGEEMKVLIACEFSGTVRDAFLSMGADAYSCDVLPSESSIKGRHFQCDVREVLGMGWDLMIGHPPCTYLSYAGSRVWNEPGRKEKREEAMKFFFELYNAPIPHICIENPRGEPITHIRPTQVIHPYYFGDTFRKRTMLWLKGLPPLYHNPSPNLFDDTATWVGEGELEYRNGRTRAVWFQKSFNKTNGWKIRSKTFPGIAQAMATQWTNYLTSIKTEIA